MVVCAIREMSRVQRPEFSVQSPESRFQRPESRAHSPESRVQRPDSSVQLLRPESRNSGMPFLVHQKRPEKRTLFSLYGIRDMRYVEFIGFLF